MKTKDLIICCCLFIFSFSLHAKEEISKLSLTAKATISKPADELQLKIGVTNLTDTAVTALEENSNKMQTIITSLETIGLTKNEYETGHFSIHPTYTPYPAHPPADWRQTINGYEVSNTITIHTDKLDMAGKIIDVANKAGANVIDNISFTLHDPRAHWKEALIAAASNAMEDAVAIASATHVQLGRVLSINLDNTHVVFAKVNSNYVAQAMGSGGEVPPIEPGEVKITANISIVYEIVPL